jgi:hypothetical protein
MRIVEYMKRTGDRDRDKPRSHNRPEEFRHICSAAPLHGEQAKQDRDRN